MLNLFFIVLALVLFLIAAAGISTGRINPVAAGLACWVASVLVGKL